MWKDRAIVEVTAAVMHSFREAGMCEKQLTTCRGIKRTWLMASII
jgi:nitric oxide synthase oxygenase domain/subunit